MLQYYEEPAFQYRFVTYPQAINATALIVGALRNTPGEVAALGDIAQATGLPLAEARAVCIGLAREGYLRQVLQANPARGLHFAGAWLEG